MAQTISHEILEAALTGLRLQEQKIQEQIAHVEAMLGGKSTTSATTSPEAPSIGKRRKFSAATRRRMAEAQKARWAAKGTSEKPGEVTPEAPKATRKLSAAGRKAISQATKKRWRLQKAAEATKSAPATKASKKAVVKKASVTAKRSTRVKKAAAKKTAPVAASLVAAAGQ